MRRCYLCKEDLARRGGRRIWFLRRGASSVWSNRADRRTACANCRKGLNVVTCEVHRQTGLVCRLCHAEAKMQAGIVSGVKLVRFVARFTLGDRVDSEFVRETVWALRQAELIDAASFVYFAGTGWRLDPEWTAPEFDRYRTHEVQIDVQTRLEQEKVKGENS